MKVVILAWGFGTRIAEEATIRPKPMVEIGGRPILWHIMWGYRESDSMGGFDPYSSSKGCAELVTAAYRRSFLGSGGRSAGVASGRAGKPTGDRDCCGTLAPCARGAMCSTLAGYLMFAERVFEDPSNFSEGWNFGPLKARDRVGWRPRMDVAEALTWVAEWQQAHATEADVRDVSESQLTRYQSMLVEE